LYNICIATVRGGDEAKGIRSKLADSGTVEGFALLWECTRRKTQLRVVHKLR